MPFWRLLGGLIMKSNEHESNDSKIKGALVHFSNQLPDHSGKCFHGNATATHDPRKSLPTFDYDNPDKAMVVGLSFSLSPVVLCRRGRVSRSRSWTCSGRAGDLRCSRLSFRISAERSSEILHMHPLLVLFSTIQARPPAMLTEGTGNITFAFGLM